MNYLPLRGACLVQTSHSDISAEELLALVNQEGMNRMFIYADWLARLSAIAKDDGRVLAALKKMRQITYTGAAINPEVSKWLVEQGIPLAVCIFFRFTEGLSPEQFHFQTMYATTEVSESRLLCWPLFLLTTSSLTQAQFLYQTLPSL
jgi:hypothetical protein